MWCSGIIYNFEDASMNYPTVFPPTAYIDFHTHRARYGDREDVLEIISSHLGDGKEGSLYTLGCHPWLTMEQLDATALSDLQDTLLNDPRCLALGECGLDKLKGPAMSIQIAILEQQLELADRHRKSVVIHCVRAYDPLLQVKKQFPNIPNWVIHGYARHDILAKSLVDQGFYLSLRWRCLLTRGF
ncbi:MAG: TatD family hydrolase [Saprospiraceae bacterium]